MKNRYKNKKEQFLFRFLRMMLFMVLSIVAVKIGIMGGSFLSKADSKIIRNIDAGTFKSTLNNSLPIIDTIYNSGNISISFSGEIKSLINNLFGFQLGDPMTILNAQSSILDSYYNHEYNNYLAQMEKDSKLDYEQKDNIPQKEKDKDYIEDSSSISFDEGKDEKKETGNNIMKEGKIILQNDTKFKVDVDALMKEPLKIKFDKKGPKVLIYHTHTTESYISSLKDLNKAVPTWTEDPGYSVVRVGEEIAQNLRKKYNTDVIHNGTIHDYPNYNASYGRSLSTITKILKSYPSIKVTLDIHRDGLADNKKLRAVTTANKKTTAQIMFVVGTDQKYTHPKWRENLKLALKLQARLNEICPGLARPIYLSYNRYNQHVTNGSLIVEVGGDGNMLSECLESTKYLSQAINDVLN